ncbi:NusB antitermination factor [Marininema mesophilum]|uniref:Transcription antitermination protein NusB n=1 Tax=Marininema mesophilum TaxID=1048340 RepID=A0A1H2UCB0_9BACL|nr:transcription antitermination factor NusB [Marininema mesophilum]SDW53755.1 NusB antitermination factor [Marininema mesophilum]
MSRRLAREQTLQTLYQLEMNPEAGEKVVLENRSRLAKGNEDNEDLAFFLRLTEGVRQHTELLDPIIQKYLKQDWTLSRLSLVDRTVLRMAVYEVLFEEEIPVGVSLNEAVDLAKTYSTEESARFINGILGNLTKNLDDIQRTIGKN